MGKELIIQTDDKGADIALIEDNRLVELHREDLDDTCSTGDVYLGRVKKFLPGLNAAFVDIGVGKDAFLHYHDLGPKIKSYSKLVSGLMNKKVSHGKIQHMDIEPETSKNDRIENVLRQGQTLMVQVIKEPISTKGPRLSTQLSMPGRYLILIPFDDNIAISKKIRNRNERKRLQDVVSSIKDRNFGVIIRTMAQERSVEELHNDYRDLISRWHTCIDGIKQKKRRLLVERNKPQTLLRDIFNDSFTGIVVDQPELADQMRDYIGSSSELNPDMVRLHRKKRPVFEEYEIDKQIRSSFGRTITIPGGAYLVIEHTEAMHVIDINSGSKKPKHVAPEEHAVSVNHQSCEAIARQLRLRDMGGIIVIDFIDMRTNANKRLIYEEMKKHMKEDRAKHTILPISKFGLMQITRQRTRPEMLIENTDPCPLCKGSGVVSKGLNIIEDIESQIQHTVASKEIKRIDIAVNPLIASHLTRGLMSTRLKWTWKYKCWIALKPSEDMPIGSFKILDHELEQNIEDQRQEIKDRKKDSRRNSRRRNNRNRSRNRRNNNSNKDVKSEKQRRSQPQNSNKSDD